MHSEGEQDSSEQTGMNPATPGNQEVPGHPISCCGFLDTERGFRFQPHLGFLSGGQVLGSGH